MRVNLGERLLSALFAPWWRSQPHDDDGGGDDGEHAGEEGASRGATDRATGGSGNDDRTGSPASSPPSSPTASSHPCFVLSPASENAVVSMHNEGVLLLKARLGAVPAAMPDGTPTWIEACVRRGQYVAREPLKVSFILAPHSSSRLPELPPASSRLTAPKALKCAKVVQYINEKLGMDESDDGVCLFCGDAPVKLHMNLGTIRIFHWRQGGDMVLAYAERGLQKD